MILSPLFPEYLLPCDYGTVRITPLVAFIGIKIIRIMSIYLKSPIRFLTGACMPSYCITAVLPFTELQPFTVNGKRFFNGFYPASIKYPTPEFFIAIWGPLTSLLHLNCKLPFADGSQKPSMIAI